MADEGQGRGRDPMLLGVLVLLTLGIFIGLYMLFMTVDAGIESIRGKVESANRETMAEVRGVRDMTKQILAMERQEMAADRAPAPAPAAPTEPAAP